MSRHRVRTEVRAGRWLLAGPRVVVLHAGPLTRRQRWWVATLHAGPHSALHVYTAAEAAGLRGWERRPVHVLVPKGVRVPPLTALVVHESRRFGSSDLEPVVGPPRVRLSRAIVDAAALETAAKPACALLAAAVHQRLTTPEQLNTEVEAAGPMRHRRVLQAVLADMGGCEGALAGIDLVRLCRLARIQLPERQRTRLDSAGRTRYLDATWRRRDGRTVQVEVDGAAHLLSRVRWEHLDSQIDARINGTHLMLRFPSVLLRLEPAVVTAQIARALGVTTRTR